MSAALSPSFDAVSERVFVRRPINVPLDLIALRSGVPENLPGRCTDLSEAGVGAVIAGELAAGLQVAVELRLPNVGVPVRARAVVRYQSRLRCGLEFVSLSVEQREMIRYWVYRASQAGLPIGADLKVPDSKKTNAAPADVPEPVAVAGESRVNQRRVKIGRGGLALLFGSVLGLAALGWWQWQKSWNELETHSLASSVGLRVSPETMEKRMVTKVDPVYPEAARVEKTEGLVVLDALIGSDGSVKGLRTISGPDLLVQSAKEAVRSWKYEPYLTNGNAVEVETTISVDFRLN
jgi:TonB family protein